MDFSELSFDQKVETAKRMISETADMRSEGFIRLGDKNVIAFVPGDPIDQKQDVFYLGVYFLKMFSESNFDVANLGKTSYTQSPGKNMEIIEDRAKRWLTIAILLSKTPRPYNRALEILISPMATPFAPQRLTMSEVVRNFRIDATTFPKQREFKSVQNPDFKDGPFLKEFLKTLRLNANRPVNIEAIFSAFDAGVSISPEKISPVFDMYIKESSFNRDVRNNGIIINQYMQNDYRPIRALVILMTSEKPAGKAFRKKYSEGLVFPQAFQQIFKVITPGNRNLTVSDFSSSFVGSG